MKKIFFLILALLILVPAAHADYDIGVVMSSRLRPYVEVLQGFRDGCAKELPPLGVKSIQPVSITIFSLSEQPDRAELKRQLAALTPDLLVAIGTNALSFLKDVRKTPVLYLMVPDPSAITDSQPNVTGIDMEIPASRQLAVFLEADPRIHRLGLIYDPKYSANLVAEIEDAARERGISLLASRADDSRKVPALLARMRGKIDGFWMLPDLTVITPQTVEALGLFSMDQRVPILTFSSKYLDQGAAVAITFDNQRLGEQAAVMAGKILSGTGIENIPPAAPESIHVHINPKVAGKLGLKRK